MVRLVRYFLCNRISYRITFSLYKQENYSVSLGEVFFPKVFPFFDFGHFFCPFFKTQNTFR